jgi:hypothetical protein
MSIIQAYKSDSDGKLFEDKKKYQLHLRKLASARLAVKRKLHRWKPSVNSSTLRWDRSRVSMN